MLLCKRSSHFPLKFNKMSTQFYKKRYFFFINFDALHKVYVYCERMVDRSIVFFMFSPIPIEAKTTEKIKIPSPPPAVSLLVSTSLQGFIFLSLDVECVFKILFDGFR